MMFAVTIAFGNTSWRLLYKTQELAENTFTAITQPVDKTREFSSQLRMSLLDDFGQKACFLLSAITGVMLENLDESKIATIELGLHNQRVQASFQTRAEQDPTCRPNGTPRAPGIITPMGPPNGRFS